MSTPQGLFWIHKNARSASLSHSQDVERIQVFSQAQRTSRLSKKAQRTRRSQNAAAFMLPAKLPPPRPALQLDATCSLEERRSIEFYRKVTTTKIVAPQDGMVFWRDDVPCLAEWCACFRHLVVSIAATHEVLVAPDAARLNVLALENCSKATKLLRESERKDPALLVASCVLIAAYNLLRGDLANVDRSVKAGLKLSTQCQHGDAYFHSPLRKELGYSQWYNGDLTNLLRLLHFRSGYRLWTHDVVFEFEKIPLTNDVMTIEPDCVKGPFVDFDQAVDSYKLLANEVVAKMLRNMTIGAYVDPTSHIAQEIGRQFGLLSFYWEMYFSSLSEEEVCQRLEMLSLRVASYNILLLFRTRLICKNEMRADLDPEILSVRWKIIKISGKILAARKAGHLLEYFDRFVNRTLWALGLYTFDDTSRRQIGTLLRDQIGMEDGLISWLRGTIIFMIADIEKNRQGVELNPEVRFVNRIVLRRYYYREQDNHLVLEYAFQHLDGPSSTREYCCPLDVTADAMPTPNEVNDCLKLIMAGYRTFGKPQLSGNPRGFVRPMFYQGKQIPVSLEVGELDSVENIQES